MFTARKYRPRGPDSRNGVSGETGAVHLSSVMVFGGFALLVLPGIFLFVATSFALLLVADRGLSPWRAIVVSIRGVTHRWFTVFGIQVAAVILMILSAIPLGIGVIWTLPLMMLANAVTYRTIFGVAQSA